mmetsp:Transcript_32986/g.92341  ORF Transcript_32986/g.92341 Transcript_32986/m.92341 type:complete len:599 (-) Transcript_32986:18-1814(-)
MGRALHNRVPMAVPPVAVPLVVLGLTMVFSAGAQDCFAFNATGECSYVTDYPVTLTVEEQQSLFDNFLALPTSDLRVIPLRACRHALVSLQCAAVYGFFSCDGNGVCLEEMCATAKEECALLGPSVPVNCSAIVLFPDRPDCHTPEKPVSVPVESCLPEGVECCPTDTLELRAFEPDGSRECAYACPIPAFGDAKDRALTYILWVFAFISIFVTILALIPFLYDRRTKTLSYPNHLTFLIALFTTLSAAAFIWAVFVGREYYICKDVDFAYFTDRVDDSDCIAQPMIFSFFVVLGMSYTLLLIVRIWFVTMLNNRTVQRFNFFQEDLRYAVVVHGVVLAVAVGVSLGLLVEAIKFADETITDASEYLAGPIVLLPFGAICIPNFDFDSVSYYIVWLVLSIILTSQIIAALAIVVNLIRLNRVVALTQWRAITVAAYYCVTSIIFQLFIYVNYDNLDKYYADVLSYTVCLFQNAREVDPPCEREYLDKFGFGVVSYILFFSNGASICAIAFLSFPETWKWYGNVLGKRRVEPLFKGQSASVSNRRCARSMTRVNSSVTKTSVEKSASSTSGTCSGEKSMGDASFVMHDYHSASNTLDLA